MKFFPKVTPQDAILYKPNENPYPSREAVENSPAIYWHRFDKNLCLRYQVWNSNTIKNSYKDLEQSSFQSDNNKFKRIIISHGFGEHIMIYARFLNDLLKKFKNIEVCIFEYEGSGLGLPIETLKREYGEKVTNYDEDFIYAGTLSEEALYKAAGNKGNTNREKQLSQLAHFVKLFKSGNAVGQIQESHENLETILFGHSLGSQLATEYAFKYVPFDLASKDKTVKENYLVDNLILCAPLYILSSPTRPPSPLIYISKMLSILIPNVKVDSELSVQEITDDKSMQNFFLNDYPYLVPCIGSILMFYQMISTGENMNSGEFFRKNKRAPKELLPKKINWVHGDADGVNDINGSKNVVRIVKETFGDSINGQFKAIKNGKHSLFACTDNIYNDFLSYIST
ncbi:hypothetical protein ACO0R3_001501 [Hanseniaspora guilliermondii]